MQVLSEKRQCPANQNNICVKLRFELIHSTSGDLDRRQYFTYPKLRYIVSFITNSGVRNIVTSNCESETLKWIDEIIGVSIYQQLIFDL